MTPGDLMPIVASVFLHILAFAVGWASCVVVGNVVHHLRSSGSR